MKIYFVRHGETDWNIDRRLQGRTDILLNVNGRHVARLTKEGMKDIHFDVAFSSPLRRAKETAEIILAGRTVEIIEDERLMEISFGPNEGVNRFTAGQNIQNFFYDTELYVAEDGAEPVADMYERVGGFLKDLFHSEKYQNSTVLVTTHGAALNGMIAVMKGYSVGELWKDGLHKNCGVTVVEVTDGRPQILQQAIVFYEE